VRSRAKCFDGLRAYVEKVPLVDCHDHSGDCGPKYTDPIQVVLDGYFVSDITSVVSEAELRTIQNGSLPLRKRWPALERAWKRTRHTGYAQVPRRVLSHFYDEPTLTLAALERVAKRLPDYSNPARYEAVLVEANIAVRLANVWKDASSVLDGTLRLPPRSLLVIGLPEYHEIRRSDDVRARVTPLGRTVTSLDEYLAACREIFEGYKRYGAVAFKDQSAYSRSIDYGNPTRAAAEEVFNAFMEDPRRSASYPDGVKPLDDFLFHEFMRMARDMDLPVQIHTGHMAGVRNDIVKTNAVHLTKLVELHRDVRFDLFHANWPYDGEILYLAKNYPNVTIDFCWANIIDPVYCQRLFRQILSSVPHAKIHGYGSDFGGQPDHAWAHACIARDNIAIALADMVDMEYIDLDDAKEVAHAWLFGNAHEFFRLGAKQRIAHRSVRAARHGRRG
jgi:uncharacterized protein